MTVEGVIFDWGGTLSVWAEVDLEDMWRAAARHIDPEKPEPLVRRLIEIESEMWRRVEATQDSTDLTEVFSLAATELGVDVASAVLEEALERHLDAWTPHIHHDPDAAGVLAALKDNGLAIGLLSNTLWPEEFHERFLERDGLSSLIDVRMYTSSMEKTKPHPTTFLETMERMGLQDPAGVVMVGDRPFDDIGGAEAVGMRTVLRPNPLITSLPGPRADAEISSLPELLDVVRRFD